MSPWPNGIEVITQCPVKPRGKFKQKIFFSTEEGTYGGMFIVTGQESLYMGQ